ncbi:MAG: hypothetical protein KGI25_07945 [Thaumarchaeota archaeon]|nr:hypothetical protein [Nitrososphaerota archaeon]
MVAYNKFQPFVQYVCNGNFNLGSDTLKVGLSNTAPTASSSSWSSITEISSGNGYTTGGNSLTGVSSSQTSGTETLSANNTTWTATGAMATFRYVVLYDSTPASNGLIAWWDYGSGISMNNGDTFTVQWNGGSSSGTIFTMS